MLLESLANEIVKVDEELLVQASRLAVERDAAVVDSLGLIQLEDELPGFESRMDLLEQQNLHDPQVLVEFGDAKDARERKSDLFLLFESMDLRGDASTNLQSAGGFTVFVDHVSTVLACFLVTEAGGKEDSPVILIDVEAEGCASDMVVAIGDVFLIDKMLKT